MLGRVATKPERRLSSRITIQLLRITGMGLLSGLFGPKTTKQRLAAMVANVIDGTLDDIDADMFMRGSIHVASSLTSVSFTGGQRPPPVGTYVASVSVAEALDDSGRAFVRGAKDLSAEMRDLGVRLCAAKITQKLGETCPAIRKLP